MRITAKLVASKLDDVLLFFFIALFLMSGIPTSNSFKSNKILKGSVIRVVVLNVNVSFVCLQGPNFTFFLI